jgi:hypothetical protein
VKKNHALFPLQKLEEVTKKNKIKLMKPKPPPSPNSNKSGLSTP